MKKLPDSIGSSVKISGTMIKLPKYWQFVDRHSIYAVKLDENGKEIATIKSAEGFNGDLLSGILSEGTKTYPIAIQTANGVSTNWSTKDWWGRLACATQSMDAFSNQKGNHLIRQKTSKNAYESCIDQLGLSKADVQQCFFCSIPERDHLWQKAIGK